MREFGYKASPEDYPSLLLSLPTAYFTKLPSLSELMTHL